MLSVGVKLTEVDELDVLELDELGDVVEDELLVEVDLVELDVVDVVGVGVGVGLGVVDVEGAAEELEAFEDDPEEPEPPPLELPESKTTTFAVTPLGTVTTQKFAPPAPDAWSELVTPPMPLTAGSMAQGRPLQPEPEHSILTP